MRPEYNNCHIYDITNAKPYRLKHSAVRGMEGERQRERDLSSSFSLMLLRHAVTDIVINDIQKNYG
jgi:hypothetical protein